MNLIEKWKNRETKKRLREENTRLKAEIEVLHKIPKPPVCTVERNVQKICATWGVKKGMPSEIVKHELLHELMAYLSDFVEYDFDKNGYGEENYTATLYVAMGDKRYESSN